MRKLKISLLAVIVVVTIFISFKVIVLSGGGVGIDVQYAGAAGGCTDQNPILVTITNRLPFEMIGYSFRISAKRDGYSSDVRFDLYSQPRSSDKIIPAFGSDSRCWLAPEQNNLSNAYMNIPKYGSLSAAKEAIEEEQNKENPSLQWFGEIKIANWAFDLRYGNY